MSRWTSNTPSWRLATSDNDSQYEVVEGESKDEDNGGVSVDEGLERAIQQGEMLDEFIRQVYSWVCNGKMMDPGVARI